MTSAFKHTSTREVPDESKSVMKRVYVLTVILVLGFSVVWLLPESPTMKISRLERQLPLRVGSMQGKRVSVTGKELQILAKDTEFERAQYLDLENQARPPIEVSVVFAGKDLNNSIHRPEVCLESQGWNFVKERKVVIKGALLDGSDLPLREIVCKQPIEVKGGGIVEIIRVQYYTFFGHTAITEDHYGRTLQDMKDRLFRGYDQQWAYATFSMPVYKQSLADQRLVDQRSVYTVEETENMLKGFIRKLAPLVIDQ